VIYIGCDIIAPNVLHVVKESYLMLFSVVTKHEIQSDALFFVDSARQSALSLHSPSLFFHVVLPSAQPLDGSFSIDGDQMKLVTAVEIVVAMPDKVST
jgi:hypothetical protein